jgi:hypothetical protein
MPQKAAGPLKTSKLRLTRLRFYLVVVALVALVWGAQTYEYHKIYSASGVIFSSTPASASPSDWQKMSVTAETNKGALLTTLATALLGAIGWLIVEARKATKKRHMWAAFLAAICAGISLYFGSASQGNLLFMLSNENFNPYDSVYTFLTRAQFLTLGVGAFFFADFAFHDFSEDD